MKDDTIITLVIVALAVALMAPVAGFIKTRIADLTASLEIPAVQPFGSTERMKAVDR